ncbi:PQQ-binding-like beta-propeller repeat protein [Streptomyces sp. HC44]|uniref:PQQ-binding-like beta-propeller repeat protein n=1 Tax=Streptomyces scabichelini TaxID=2711217 RepID=A0A6G4V2N3_9ACTN|nr:PQQ-binding-like beta-propeller repeat protein [Streptomyces scabichelini]
MPEDVGDFEDVEDEIVTRLEQEPGSRLWTLTAPADTLSQPVVTEDRVYVSVGGRITAFDLDTGKERWRSPYRDTASRRVWDFTVAGGCVVVPWERTPRPSLPQGVTVTVLDTESGTVLRHIAVPRMSSCVSDGRTVIAAHFTDPDWALSGYDVLGGDALWTRPMPHIEVNWQAAESHYLKTASDSHAKEWTAALQQKSRGLVRHMAP